MAETSLVEKMSYLQSQMHLDESMESIADSDLEDGELQKLLTSQLYAQRASGRNLSNLSGTLLEGNKDHFLSQARSDLAKRELHVESLNKCVDDLQKLTEAQSRALQDAQNEFVESRREQT